MCGNMTTGTADTIVLGENGIRKKFFAQLGFGFYWAGFIKADAKNNCHSQSPYDPPFFHSTKVQNIDAIGYFTINQWYE